MDFSKISEGLSWFAEKANEAIWGVVYHAASAFATEAFALVVKYVVIETDPDKLFEFSQYLSAMQAIALALLLTAVVWEGVKYQTGSLGEETTLQSLIMKTGFAAICIYILPWSVDNFFIKINNLLIQMINSMGVKIETGSTIFSLVLAPKQLSAMIICMFVIFTVALIGLGIVAGIRYIEIIILTLIAPLAAVSIVRGGELLDVWIRETMAVVFTQALQLFLLQLLANILGKMSSSPLEAFIPAIGATVVMLMGPHALRKFVYSTGAGGAGTKAAGGLSKIAVYKTLTKGVVK